MELLARGWLIATGMLWFLWVVTAALVNGSSIVVIGTFLGVGSIWVILGLLPVLACCILSHIE